MLLILIVRRSKNEHDRILFFFQIHVRCSDICDGENQRRSNDLHQHEQVLRHCPRYYHCSVSCDFTILIINPEKQNVKDIVFCIFLPLKLSCPSRWKLYYSRFCYDIAVPNCFCFLFIKLFQYIFSFVNEKKKLR